MSEPLPRPQSAALDPRARALLDFEREWPLRDDGSKEAAIRAALGISKQRYHELLQRLADLPEAYAYDPLTVLRLRRRRRRMEQRRNAEALGERRQ
jgi:hypothetical protein